MPLNCDCFPGCWGVHSENWPKIKMNSKGKYLRLLREIVPHGSYVVFDDHVRIETQDLADTFYIALNKLMYQEIVKDYPIPAAPSPSLNTPQPPPKLSPDSAAVWPMVIKDMLERDNIGRQKYGQPLMTGDGRDSLTDAYQEALDLSVYIRKEIEDRRNNPLLNMTGIHLGMEKRGNVCYIVVSVVIGNSRYSIIREATTHRNGQFDHFVGIPGILECIK